MNDNRCDYKTNHSLIISKLEHNGSAIPTVSETNKSETARCEYFSNRTRLKCKSVRRVDELNSFGYCEKVFFLIKKYFYKILAQWLH